MKRIGTFTLKDGRIVDIVLPSMDGLRAITDFVNKLSIEDTYLSFAGETYSLEYEKSYLENVLREIKFSKNYILWAVYNDQIVGNCDIKKGAKRSEHVGTIGLMVDKDFRGQGLGEYLLKQILNKGQEMGFKIVSLSVFDDNVPAKKLYQKLGFKESARLPNGFYRQGKYTDALKMYKVIGTFDDE